MAKWSAVCPCTARQPPIERVRRLLDDVAHQPGVAQRDRREDVMPATASEEQRCASINRRSVDRHPADHADAVVARRVGRVGAPSSRRRIRIEIAAGRCEIQRLRTVCVVARCTSAGSSSMKPADGRGVLQSATTSASIAEALRPSTFGLQRAPARKSMFPGHVEQRMGQLRLWIRAAGARRGGLWRVFGDIRATVGQAVSNSA